MKWAFLAKKETGIPKPKKSKTREWVDAIIFAVIASTIIKGLLFSAYAIPFRINGRNGAYRRLYFCK